MSNPSSMIEVGVGQCVFCADRPFSAYSPHVMAVQLVVRGELNCAGQIVGSVVDSTPHVVRDFFPHLHRVVNLRYGVIRHIRVPTLRKTHGW